MVPSEHRQPQRARARAALVVAGLLLLGSGAWFAASWIDIGTDSTCGAVTRPSVWLDGSPRGCQGIMTIRTAISVATFAAGAALIYYSAAGTRLVTPARAAAILAMVAAISTAMLLINESVRSDGAF